MKTAPSPSFTRILGGLLLMVRRSLRQHAVSTLVTIASVALATGLVMSVVSINAQAYEAFTGGQTGFDAVVGARGSQLQLVLNSIFHLETSPGNIPWSMYTTLRSNPMVELAVPYAVGDNYKGYRIVGTTPDIFTRLEYQKGKHFEFEPGGRAFDPLKNEAVIGSFAAQKTGLVVGSTFNPYHGVTFAANMRHTDEYTVVAIMKPTNSPSDRVVWIPIDGIFHMSGHVLRGTGREYTAKPGELVPDKYKEVSAVLLKFKTPFAGFTLDQTINRQGTVATMAWPIGRVMAELFDKLGWMNSILTMVACLVVLVASASIMASIYNSINERRREFAILRALGARRSIVFSAILLESSAIALAGTVVGYLVYIAIFSAASVVVRSQTGVVLEVFHYHPVLILTPLMMMVLGALAGVIPAIKAYRTDVATNLAPLS